MIRPGNSLNKHLNAAATLREANPNPDSLYYPKGPLSDKNCDTYKDIEMCHLAHGKEAVSGDGL